MKLRPSALRGRRLCAGAALALVIALVLGCLGPIYVGEQGKKTEGEVLSQNGQLEIAPGIEQDVYYPVPYATTPNLEIHEMSFAQVIEQKPDHFRIACPKGNTGFGRLEWKARGVKAEPAVAATVEAPATAKPAAAVQADATAPYPSRPVE